jgi:hypothetical protein
MKIYALWEEGDAREMPWMVAAVDEYSVEDCGWPDEYLKERDKTPHDRRRRELTIEIPDSAVTKLFDTPVVQGKAVKSEE